MRSAASKPLEPARQMALKPPRLAWIGTLACAALMGVSFLIPNPQAQAIRAQEAFHAEMVEQAQKVDEGATALDAEAAETPELRRLLGELSGELRRAGKRTRRFDRHRHRRAQGGKPGGAHGQGCAWMPCAPLVLTRWHSRWRMATRRPRSRHWRRETRKALLSDAAAKARTRRAAQQLSQAAQALASGEARQALSALTAAASGQTAASAQALAPDRHGARRGGAFGHAERSGAPSLRWRIAAQDSRARAIRRDRGNPAAGPAWARPTGDGGVNPAQAAVPAQGTASPEKKVAAYEAIYDTTRLGTSREVQNERGQMGEGEILEAEAGNGAGSLEGSVPYRQALPEYREAAVEAAQDADLPAYARQWVETYFNALAQ